MDRPGKLTFKILTYDDISDIETFCKECENLGYMNNVSLKTMKFDQAIFFGAYDGTRIVSLAGVHKLPEINEHAYRCLFRGAQLPTYTPVWSMNIFDSGIHFSQFIYMQIIYVLEFDKDAEFYISTNINKSSAGKSYKMHKIMMPRLAKQGYWDLIDSNIMLFNTEQSLWKINVQYYMEAREIWLKSQNYIY